MLLDVGSSNSRDASQATTSGNTIHIIHSISKRKIIRQMRLGR